MPFRLTRQLTGVLRPLGCDALLLAPMTATMAALRAQRDTLLRAIQIFVNDPIADWAALSKKLRNERYSVIADLADDGGGDAAAAAATVGAATVGAAGRRVGSETMAATVTRARVLTVRYKLELYSPNYTTERDLKLSMHASKEAVMDGLRKVIAPLPDSERARAGDKCADVAQQMRCLIEMATSPNILSHTYFGWGPYV